MLWFRVNNLGRLGETSPSWLRIMKFARRMSYSTCTYLNEVRTSTYKLIIYGWWPQPFRLSTIRSELLELPPCHTISLLYTIGDIRARAVQSTRCPQAPRGPFGTLLLTIKLIVYTQRLQGNAIDKWRTTRRLWRRSEMKAARSKPVPVGKHRRVCPVLARLLHPYPLGRFRTIHCLYSMPSLHVALILKCWLKSKTK